MSARFATSHAAVSMRESSATRPCATGANGPLGSTPTNGYWADLRDLYIYGDQFRNFDIEAAGDGSHVLLPNASLEEKYAASADADGLFSAASPANQVRTDGVAQFKILGVAGRDAT